MVLSAATSIAATFNATYVATAVALSSAAECEAAATLLGLADTTAYSGFYSGRPPACAYSTNSFLNWNTNGWASSAWCGGE